ncbi:hypothetical protein ACFLSV_02990 [Bacteroidota bacterium]
MQGTTRQGSYRKRPACCTCLLPGRGREVKSGYDSTTNVTK